MTDDGQDVAKSVIEILQLQITSGGRNETLLIPGLEIVSMIPTVTLRIRINGEVIAVASTGNNIPDAIFNALCQRIIGISLKACKTTGRYRDGHPIIRATVVIIIKHSDGGKKETKGFAAHPDYGFALCSAMANALNNGQ